MRLFDIFLEITDTMLFYCLGKISEYENGVNFFVKWSIFPLLILLPFYFPYLFFFQNGNLLMWL